MNFLPKRYLEEFFLYSSQFVVFFIIMLFTSPVISPLQPVALVVLNVFLLIQIGLLARFGHKPLPRFFFSLLTPAGYSVLEALTRSVLPIDMASFFLWATALYVAAIQAISIVARRKWPKRLLESLLTAGTVFTFIFFYFYLDLRVNLASRVTRGELGYDGYLVAVSMGNLVPAFLAFAKSTQHLFFIAGAFMFGLIQAADKVKHISLMVRLDAVYSVVAPPELGKVPHMGTVKGENRELVILYADIWNFTPIAEKCSADETMEILNRYYAMWDIVVRKNRGQIDQFVGDTVIAVFGLMGEKDAYENAVRCGLDFLADFSNFQEDLTDRNLPFVKHVGIGIHAGKAAIGELATAGGQGRVAVVGDAVNVAARLDSLCREFKQDLLVSHPVYRQLSIETQAGLQPMGEVLFRGRGQPQAVYGKR